MVYGVAVGDIKYSEGIWYGIRIYREEDSKGIWYMV